MRTTLTISGQSFESLATPEEATRWAVLDRAFPQSADAVVVATSLAKASYWLEDVAPIPSGEPSDNVVRCVVRLATYYAVGELVPVGPSPASVSNGGVTVDMRYAGSQDRDEANRLGFPDVESYRLVKPLLQQGGGWAGLTRPSVFNPDDVII